MTIHRLLEELIQEGIVICKRGSGVYVAKEQLNIYIYYQYIGER